VTDAALLDEQSLHDWVVSQRWFASKAREVAQMNVLDAKALRQEEPELHLLLLEARFPEGTHDVYQVPLGVRSRFDEGVIATGADGRVVYDMLADPELTTYVPRLIERGAGIGDLRFQVAEGGPEIGEPASSRAMGVEQSNSSLVFDERLVLKVFRRLEPGTNPELEMLRFLTAKGFRNIAALAGWYSYEGRIVDATLGVLQEFLADGRDGWELTLDTMGDAAQIERLADLGRVTGQMHTTLASDSSDAHFAPEDPSDEYLSLLHADVDEQIERLWRDLPEDDERVADVAGSGEDVRELLNQLSTVSAGGKLIRTHGDYHLGQTMLTDRGWVILDFEGEPARPLPERRRKQSPLRDVAGMLRSFAYAQSAMSLLRGGEAPAGWEASAREAFLDAYIDTVDPSLLPAGASATERLLSVFELEKAVYELRYELNNRPDWVAIPAAAIRRLLEAA